MVAICGPPPCTTTGLIAVCSSSTMSRAKALRGVLVAHGMAAILDDDGFLVIFLHVRQRLGQDAGLVERADLGVGHEPVSRADGGCRAGFYPIAGQGAKPRKYPLPLWEKATTIHTRSAATPAATASTSQLAIKSVPPVGAAIGNRPWPAYCRSVRSPANSAAAMTKPNAASSADAARGPARAPRSATVASTAQA